MRPIVADDALTGIGQAANRYFRSAADPDDPAEDIPAFQWYDQRGNYFSATLLPFQDGFNDPDQFRTTGPGGLLGLLLGASGPFTTVGLINISDLRLDLPIRAQGGAPAQA